MTDVPEACPFCGSGRSELKGVGVNRYKCGTHWWRGDKPFRNAACFERQIEQVTAKAEALDRLEEMSKELDQVVFDNLAPGLVVMLNQWQKPRVEIESTGPDLASTINAAFAQWKESK